jgi:4'-phosphopantetheinyl transferase EntD
VIKPFGTAFTDALPFGVLTAVHLPDSKDPVPQGILDQLPPQERDYAITLGGYRQVDFVGGRLALHRAIRSMGRKAGAVLAGPRGEPILPDGVAASISHKRTLAVALAARAGHGSLGVDLEDQGPPRMILLDTDHFSALQVANSRRDLLRARMAASPDKHFAVTAVTLEEQLRGWLAEIAR